MGYALSGFQSLGAMGTPDGTAGSRRSMHTYITTDAPATVETADYFLSLNKRLKPGDLLLVSYKNAVYRARVYIFATSAASGVTIKQQDDTDSTGGTPRQVVATAAGLTTGLILDSDSFVEVTNGGDVNNWSTLPACSEATRGREIWIYAKTANSELRTPAASTDTINNLNCGAGANEALLTAGNLYILRQTLANGWIMQGFTNVGAVMTAVIPD